MCKCGFSYATESTSSMSTQETQHSNHVLELLVNMF